MKFNTQKYGLDAAFKPYKVILLFIIIFLGAFGAILFALPSAKQVNEAIGYIEECRDIHIDWVEYLTFNSEFNSSQVGDAQWHQEWVERYNHTLKVLYVTRSVAQLTGWHWWESVFLGLVFNR